MPFSSLVSAVIVLVLSAQPAAAEGPAAIQLGFSADDLGDTWQVIEFPDKNPTNYSYQPDSNAVCARAQSSAAGLAREFPAKREGLTELSWEWRTDGRIEEGNARKKSGDDYAGRVYVNYRSDDGLSYWERLKLSTYETVYGQNIPRRSINFVWANKLKPGSVVPSPYTDRVTLVALRNQADTTDTWVRESVNLETFYARIYGKKYAAPDSLAIMTDTDSTGDVITTCYRNIRLTK
ncbi:MAG: DUF3047 domain-containing protein [bacterium]